MPIEKKVWQIDTEKLAQEIGIVSQRARTEEDLKMGVEPLLRKAFRDLGVDVDEVRYEKTAVGYRSKRDAVYGYLVIEYKAPGKLNKKTTLTEAKEQLRQYLLEEAGHLGPDKESALEKEVGVCLDGEQIFFARYSRVPRMSVPPIPISTDELERLPQQEVSSGFHFLGPFPITSQSLANLLIYARSAARRPLTAQALATVFGPEHPVARQAVSELYSAAMRGQRRSAPSRVKTFFREWDRLFGVVYGQELEKAEQAATETAVLYQLPGGVRLKPLLFAIHTYYAFLMKMIAIELLAMQRESTVVSFVSELPQLDDQALRAKLIHLESGADFNSQGIINFLEADFFSWYLDDWTPQLAKAFRGILRGMAEFEPATPILEPEWTRDLLQKLYELIVPQKLRHDLGEYYTPDWLAGYLVEKSGYDGASGVRFLDPSCGSGTFLVQAIHRAIGHAEKNKNAPAAEKGHDILENIVGFDINPLAVLAARTNYLIAFSRFIRYVRPISLPVYLCDSVLTPEYYAKGSLLSNDLVFTTTEGDYSFPLSMKDKEKIDRFTSLVDTALRSKLDQAAFARMTAAKIPLPEEEQTPLVAIYAKIKELDDKGQDGIWARYIKNAFAPVYMGKFDFVIGNPPWIRWGYLSDDYRNRTLNLWKEYGLFSLTGHAARLGAGEKDFSMLFTYAAADYYLKEEGILGFVITQEVFKSKGAGEGFRRFELKDSGIPLKVRILEDMVDLKPFQAANKTTIFLLEKGRATTYPVSVVEWKRKPGVGRILPEWSLSEVLEKTERRVMQAVPVDPEKPVSSWQTAPRSELKTLGRLKGINSYQARLGVRVEPYGVFWLHLKEIRPDGLLVVANQHDRGKREIPPVQTAIESALVYPAVSGGEIVPFGIKEPFYLLISQDPETRAPYPEDWMLGHVPLTYAYLNQFKEILLSRGSRVVRQFAEKTEFYAMYGIGDYSFARYRVVWKRMASKMSAVVLSTVRTPFGTKTILSTDTTSFFPVETKLEAHYLCAIINSALADQLIRSFSSAGRGFGAPSVMNTFAIPKFDPTNRIHLRLAELSQAAHAAVKRDQEPSSIQDEINGTVLKIWNIKS